MVEALALSWRYTSNSFCSTKNCKSVKLLRCNNFEHSFRSGAGQGVQGFQGSHCGQGDQGGQVGYGGQVGHGSQSVQSGQGGQGHAVRNS